MTVLASELWAGANNAALPTQWTATHVSGTGSDLQNGSAGCKMTTASTAFNTERIYLSGMTAATDQEIFTTFNVTGQTSAFLHFVLNSTGVTNTNNNAYTSQGYGMLVTVAATAGSSTIQLTKAAASTNTTLNTAVTTTITAGTTYSVRFQRNGSTIRYKIWTGSEPGAWTVSVTDGGTLLGTGAPAVLWQTGTAVAHLVTLGTVTIYDNSALPYRVQFAAANNSYNGSTTFTSLAATLGSAATAGNLLIASWALDKNCGTFTGPSGYTQILAQDGASVSQAVYYKIAAGGETSATLTWGTAIFGAAATIIEYTNVDNTTPFIGNDTGGTYSDTAVTSKSFSATTPTVDAAAVAIMAIDTVSTTTGFNIAATGFKFANQTTFSVGSGSPGLSFAEGALKTGVADAPTFSWTDSDQVQGVLLQMQPPSASAFSTTAALTGAGALTATNLPSVIGIASMGGSGALSTTVKPGVVTTAALSGAGSLSGAVTGLAITQTSGLSGNGALSGVVKPAVVTAVALAGSGALSATNVPAVVTTAALAGSGALTTTAVASIPLATEGWDLGSNGSPWPAQWTISQTGGTGGSSQEVTGGYGQLNGGTVSNYATERAYLNTVTATDMDVRVDFNMTTAQYESSVLIGLNSDNGIAADGFPTWGYVAQVLYMSPSSTGSISITKWVGGGSFSTLISETYNLVVGTWYSFRYNRTANVLSWRLWAQGSAEPGTWDYQVTDTGTLIPSGSLSLHAQNGNAALQAVVNFDNMVLTGHSAVVAGLSGTGSLSATNVPAVTLNAGLSGTGALTETNVPAVIATGGLSGAGALSVTAKPVLTATAALAGTGSLTATNTPAVVTSAGLAGAGSLTATNSPSLLLSPGLTGTGALSAAVQESLTLAPALTGAGVLSVTAKPVLAVTAALSGVGSLTVATLPALPATAALAGVGALSAATANAFSANAGLAGAGSLTATNKPGVVTTAALSGAGLLTVTNLPSLIVTPQLAGAGSLTATNTPSLLLTPTLTGAGALTATPVPAILVSAPLTGAGALTVTAVPAIPVAAALTGAGALTATNKPAIVTTAALSGTGTLIGLTANSASDTASMSGSGTLSAGSVPSVSAGAVLAGSGSLTAASVPGLTASPGLAGSGNLTAAFIAQMIGAAPLSGSGSLTSSGGPSFPGSAPLSGSGVLTASLLTGFQVLAALAGDGELTAVAVVGQPPKPFVLLIASIMLNPLTAAVLESPVTAEISGSPIGATATLSPVEVASAALSPITAGVTT